MVLDKDLNSGDFFIKEIFVTVPSTDKVIFALFMKDLMMCLGVTFNTISMMRSEGEFIEGFLIKKIQESPFKITDLDLSSKVYLGIILDFCKIILMSISTQLMI